MKLTWFGGTTMRIHIGGSILVVDPDGAPETIDANELVSGADAVIAGFGSALQEIETSRWKPRRPPRLLDETEEPQGVQTWRPGAGSVLIDAVGEPPLLLISTEVPKLGRWADDAVIVLFGAAEALCTLGLAVLSDTPPRLLGLAGREEAIDLTIPVLRHQLDGTGLVALEAGLAVEV